MNSNINLANALTKSEITERTEVAKNDLHHYLSRIDNLWNRSPSLQNTYPRMKDSEFYKYIDTEAIIFYRELQACAVKFPTWQDMITVGGETDLRLFLQIGRSCYEDIIKHIPVKSSLQRILDFGVGCGRTARHFYRYITLYEIHGCDVDATPINYIYENMPLIQPLLSTNAPPLSYESNYFDAIYSVSVFSHLKESSFYAWAEELARILKQRGILIITIHGLHALNITRNKEDVGSIGIDKDTFHSEEAMVSKSGFIWMPQETTSPDIDTSQYGISFLDKSRITDHLPASLDVIHYGEGEISGWQDLVVLQKK